jgi:hypothetical protein
MQPFDPWTWRDPAALAGGYEQASPSAAPPPGDDPGDSGERPAEADRGVLDLRGYRVEAVDGRVGTVDGADGNGLLVDTGPWIFGRTVRLPVGTVERVDHLDRVVHLDRTREQVKDAPEGDPDTVGEYWSGTYR